MTKFVLLLALLFVCLKSEAASCEYSSEGIKRAYDQVITRFPKPNAIPPFNCLLEIHRKGKGLVKVLAGNALRPLLAGRPLAGRGTEENAEKMAKLLRKVALHSKDVVNDSFLQEYAEGQWSLYDLFCKAPWQEQCVLFLPDENQVKKEGELIASSSMMVLKSAYLNLQGEDQVAVGLRIKNLHQQIPSKDPLKRKVIEQIYRELFGPKLSVELLGSVN